MKSIALDAEGVKIQCIDNLNAFMPLEAYKSNVVTCKMRPTSLLQKLATKEEVANMVAYFCRPLAAATNGAALRVDGGTVRSIL